MTGFYRNGCCDTGSEDQGVHVVCAVMTEEFLVFSREHGNDLTMPVELYDFPGLKPGNYPEDVEAWAGTWTGVLPVRQAVGDPIPAPDLPKGVPVPDAVARYGERFAR